MTPILPDDGGVPSLPLMVRILAGNVMARIAAYLDAYEPGSSSR
jgi:hypothetical protein